MSVIALLPSPLLGPAVWAGVADELAARGERVALVEVGERAPESPDDVLAELLAGLVAAAPDDEVVLVPHSNAGRYVPALAARRRVAAVVFVDAALPPFGGGEAPAAPPAFYDFLVGLADAGGVLPWTQWWGEDVGSLFPDAGVRERVEREQRRLPLAYFRGAVPAPAGWETLPCVYLAFGETYAAEVRAARERGWPVTVLTGEHLHMTVDPVGVAVEIRALLARATS